MQNKAWKLTTIEEGEYWKSLSNHAKESTHFSPSWKHASRS